MAHTLPENGWLTVQAAPAVSSSSGGRHVKSWSMTQRSNAHNSGSAQWPAPPAPMLHTLYVLTLRTVTVPPCTSISAGDVGPVSAAMSTSSGHPNNCVHCCHESPPATVRLLCKHTYATKEATSSRTVRSLTSCICKTAAVPWCHPSMGGRTMAAAGDLGCSGGTRVGPRAPFVPCVPSPSVARCRLASRRKWLGRSGADPLRRNKERGGAGAVATVGNGGGGSATDAPGDSCVGGCCGERSAASSSDCTTTTPSMSLHTSVVGLLVRRRPLALLPPVPSLRLSSWLSPSSLSVSPPLSVVPPGDENAGSVDALEAARDNAATGCIPENDGIVANGRHMRSSCSMAAGSRGCSSSCSVTTSARATTKASSLSWSPNWNSLPLSSTPCSRAKSFRDCSTSWVCTSSGNGGSGSARNAFRNFFMVLRYADLSRQSSMSCRHEVHASRSGPVGDGMELNDPARDHARGSGVQPALSARASARTRSTSGNASLGSIMTAVAPTATHRLPAMVSVANARPDVTRRLASCKAG